MLKKSYKCTKNSHPLVHCITNYVTVNDCANILLACGGSPIMADDIQEVEEITSICGGLVLNIGTLNRATIPAMFLAGERASELGHPIILDPVGAGASNLRTMTAIGLLEELKVTAIRGNISEIKTLAKGRGTTKGVDADIADAVTKDNISEVIVFAKEYAKETGALVAISGAIDIIADEETAYVIRNGHPKMANITGSGCMLTAMVGAYLAANPGNALEATATAFCAMGVCGELAYNRLRTCGGGNSSYRDYLIDAISNLTEEELEMYAKITRV